MSFLSRPTIRVADPNPFGEVTLVPAPISGKPQTELTRNLAQGLIDTLNGARIAQHVAQTLGDSPLVSRISSLAALMRR